MILSAKDISERLASQADRYAAMLLPNGKMSGGNWCVGSADGEKGKSLKVQLTGPKAGLFADFAGNDKGDLLTLTALVHKVTLGQAIKEAKEWLGIRDPESVVPKKTYAKPQSKDAKGFKAGSAVEKYLLNERGLNGLTLMAFKLRESKSDQGPEVVFPFLSPEGDLVNLKYLALKRTEDGKKLIRQSPGCAPSLFGWQAIDPDARSVVITEGEMDAMSWKQMGFDALSVNGGAGNHQWIDYEWERLEQFDSIWLHYDDDLEGKKHVREVARRLGLHRCFIVTMPGFKDANEALVAECDESVFQSAITKSKPLSPEEIKTPLDFKQRVLDKFFPPEGRQPGFWSDLLDRRLGMRPGEVTMWTGISSHGKSLLLTQLMLEAVIFGDKVAIASMEMRGEQTLHRVVCQSEQTQQPTAANVEAILAWLSGKMWIYDILGNVSVSKLLSLMEYSYARHGVNQFVIDSLMKCGVDSDDYDAQRRFLNDLCAMAQRYEIHINIVAHARKGKDETMAPGKLDVKGSSDLINQPDNILSVWRNKDKEARNRKAGTDPWRDESDCDAIVSCEKQRETGDEFFSRLTFFRRSFLFGKFKVADPPDLNVTGSNKNQNQEEMSYVNGQNPADPN